MSETQQSAAHEALIAKLNEPGVANALSNVLNHADLLALLVEGLDGFVSRSEVIGDSVISSIADVRRAAEADGASDVDVAGVLKSVVQLAGVLPKAAPGMVSAVESGAIDRLLTSELVSSQAVDQIEIVARGLTQGSARFASNPVEVGGLFSLGRLLKDPDINRALSYFATVAKAIGSELGKN